MYLEAAETCIKQCSLQYFVPLLAQTLGSSVYYLHAGGELGVVLALLVKAGADLG